MARQGAKRRRTQRGKPTEIQQESGVSAAQPREPVAAAGTAEPTARKKSWLWRMRGRVAIILLALLMIAAPSLAGQARYLFGGTARPPAGLVFVRGSQLLMAGAGSGGELVLATMPGSAIPRYQAVSPDGRRLAFTYTYGTYRQDDWGGDLYILDLPVGDEPPGKPRMVLEHAKPGDLVDAVSWSPDGRLLLIEYEETLLKDGAYMGTRSALQKFDIETKERTTIVQDAADPNWSPDGRRIAYVRNDPEQGQSLWIAQPDGAGAQQIAKAGEFIGLQAPRFSPDSTQLLFAGSPGTITGKSPERPRRAWHERLGVSVARAHGIPWDLWVWKEGQALRQVTQLGQDFPYPAWSPQGDRIALVTDVGVYSMEPDGGKLKQVELRADFRGLAWVER